MVAGAGHFLLKKWICGVLMVVGTIAASWLMWLIKH